MTHPDSTPETNRARFLGRQTELSVLHRGLDAAIEGSGGAFLVEGEAGIGKTSLAEWFSKEARRRGARIAWGRGWDGEDAGAYWPWIEILRSLLGDPAGRAALAELGESSRILGSLDPALPVSVAPAEGWRLDDPHGKHRLFDTLTRLLDGLARKAPLVLVLDDLQVADRSSLLLLDHLVSRLTWKRIVLVATRRTGESGKHAPGEEWIESRSGRFRMIPLDGLVEADVASHVLAISGEVLVPELARKLHAWTNGNPYFVEQAVRYLSGEASLRENLSDSLPLPSEVRWTVRNRLQLLPADALEVLHLASIFGQEFELSALQQAAGLPKDRLDALLEEGAQRGFVVIVGSGRWAFVHGLVREVLDAELETERRAGLHAAAARVLEAELASRPFARVARVAHHWFQAIPVAGPAKAIEYTRAAAEAAMDVAAYEVAESLYERGLEIIRASHRDSGDEIDLLLLLAKARHRAGNLRGAQEVYRKTAELARTIGDVQRLARAALGFAVSRSETGRPDDEITSILEEALADPSALTPGLRTQLLARYAIAQYFRGRLDEAEASSFEAVRIARRSESPSALAAAWNARHFALWGSPDLETRLEIATQVVAQAGRAEDLDLSLDGRLWKITDLLEAENLEAVEAEIEEIELEAGRLRLPSYRWAALLARSMWSLARGNLDEAERLAHEALTVGLEIGEENAAQFHGIQISMVRSFQGRFEELELPVRAFVEEFPGVAAWRAALALLYAESGQLDRAREHFEILARHDFTDIPRDGNWIGTIAPAIRTSWHLQDARRAEILRDLIAPHRHRAVVFAIGASFNGPVELFHAMMSALAGNWADAEQAFERIAATPDEGTCIPTRAIGLLDHARSILRFAPEPDTSRVRELLDRAIGLFRRHAMHAHGGLAEQVRRAVDHAEATGGDLRSASHLIGEAPVIRCVWIREGNTWLVGRDQAPMRFDGAKGFPYLARLLETPGSPVESAALYASASGERDLDPEKMRIYVARAIGRVRRRIAKEDPLLGSHLQASVRTGRSCRYDPAGDFSVSWTVKC